jgi:hypothetical protein
MDRWLAKFADREKADRPAKYLCGFRDGAVLYPGLGHVRPFVPLVIVEGEFDALLLQQELGDLASVVTTGAASETTGPNVQRALAVAGRFYVATDADSAGKKAAASWRRGSVRVGPPEPYKDWTAMWQGGGNLREFWEPKLFSED